jgi:hypothetical protein
MMIAEHAHDAEGGLIPELHFTDLAPLREPAEAGEDADLRAAAIAVARRSGLSDGIPFILGDDGGYDHDLNCFFRACPTMGVRSPNSLRAYARDLLVWMRFLLERRDGKSVWSADREDVAAFHAARRRSEPPHRISAASWNRGVAALEKFYGWAAEEGLIDVSPFGSRIALREMGRGRYGPVRASRARELGARRGNLRFIGLDLFLLFRDIGLRGRMDDGRDDED